MQPCTPLPPARTRVQQAKSMESERWRARLSCASSTAPPPTSSGCCCACSPRLPTAAGSAAAPPPAAPSAASSSSTSASAAAVTPSEWAAAAATAAAPTACCSSQNAASRRPSCCTAGPAGALSRSTAASAWQQPLSSPATRSRCGACRAEAPSRALPACSGYRIIMAEDSSVRACGVAGASIVGAAVGRSGCAPDSQGSRCRRGGKPQAPQLCGKGSACRLAGAPAAAGAGRAARGTRGCAGRCLSQSG